ncbi:MAG: Rieske (2Fe-2S) protein [Caldilineaceae bacterium]
MRAPLHVQDAKYPLFGYTADGERTSSYVNEILFPTDVIIVFKPGMSTPTVFLARSPHGGCLLLWHPADLKFEDPCFGSRFDLEGNYWSGPSPRALDKLPSTVRGNMLWVKGEIIYGKSHQ